MNVDVPALEIVVVPALLMSMFKCRCSSAMFCRCSVVRVSMFYSDRVDVQAHRNVAVREH